MKQTRLKKTEEGYIKKSIESMSFAFKKNDQNKNAIAISKDVRFNEKVYTVLPIFNTVLWYCKEKAHNYSPSAWRYYRSAFNFYANNEFNHNRISKEKLDKIKEILSLTKSGEKTYIPKRTSANKAKSLNEKDVKELLNFIASSNNKWSTATGLWIRSGIIAGLRPVEWSEVDVNKDDKNKLFLVVKNAKNTNNRSHGENRTIDLSFLNSEDEKCVKNHIKVAKGFYENDLWKKYYEGCSNFLRIVTRKLWPKRTKYPTLYTFRHQFSANLKASGYTPEEVASLMGHASDQTAQEHYGKKRYGNKGKGPKPNKNDVKNVKIKTKQKFDFKDVKK
jgi:integrase